jgi:transposase
VKLASRITTHREKIHATLDHRLSNALIESVNWSAPGFVDT